MIPFARIVKYGNAAPSPGHIIKIQSSRINQTNLMFLSSNGDLWAIGTNNSGMFGTGNTTALSVWTKIATNVKNFWSDSTASPGGIVLYITNDNRWYTSGSVSAIGVNASSTTVFTERTSTFSAISYNDIKYLDLTYENICIVTNSGSIYTGGQNSDGRLGNNTTSYSTFALRTDITTPVSKARFSRTGNTFYILLNDGTLRGSGTGGSGQLNASPTRSNFFTLNTGVLDFWAGNLNYIAKKSDGYYVAGANQNGQNGNGTTSGNVTTPTLVSAIGNPDYMYVTSSSFVTFNSSTSQYQYWGANSNGKLATGNTNSPSVPTNHDGISIPGFSHAESIFNIGWMANGSNTSFILGNDYQIYTAGSVGIHTPGVTVNTARFQKITLPSPY